MVVADGLVLVGGVPADAGGGTESLGVVQRRDVRLGAVGDAGGVREQVRDGDGAFGRHDVRRRVVVRRATVVFAKVGMKWPTGSLRPILPSSTSARMAALVMALVCEAMRKIVSVVMRRPASLSLQPTARS